MPGKRNVCKLGKSEERKTKVKKLIVRIMMDEKNGKGKKIEHGREREREKER